MAPRANWIPKPATLCLEEDIARGYEAGKGQYLLVEDQEIEAVQIAVGVEGSGGKASR
jgi:hypothetical protein